MGTGRCRRALARAVADRCVFAKCNARPTDTLNHPSVEPPGPPSRTETKRGEHLPDGKHLPSPAR